MNYLQKLELDVQQEANSRNKTILKILLDFNSCSHQRINQLKYTSIAQEFAYSIYYQLGEYPTQSSLIYFEKMIEDFIIFIKDLVDVGWSYFECYNKVANYIENINNNMKYPIKVFPSFPCELISKLKNKDYKNKVELFLLECLETKHISNVSWIPEFSLTHN